MVERVQSSRNRNDHEEALADDLVKSVVQGPKITAEQYSLAISSSWQKAVDSIINTGRLLIKAKDDLPGGQWGPMVKTLPFGPTTAQALMRIARHPVLSDPQFIAHLPASWGTLADLTTIKPEEAVADLIAAKKIHAGMTRKDAAEVILRHRAAGDYEFDQIVEALAVLEKFRERWPDPAEITERVFDEMICECTELDVRAIDAQPTVEWLALLVEGFGPLQEMWDRWPEEDDAPPLPKRNRKRRRKPLPFFTKRLLSDVDDRSTLDDDDADLVEPTPDELAAFEEEEVEEGRDVCIDEPTNDASEEPEDA